MFTTSSNTGTYAEYTLSSPQFTFKLADELTFEEGSAIGVPYFTVNIVNNFISFLTLVQQEL